MVLCHTGITIAKALVSRSTTVLKSLSLTLHLTAWKAVQMRLPHTPTGYRRQAQVRGQMLRELTLQSPIWGTLCSSWGVPSRP